MVVLAVMFMMMGVCRGQGMASLPGSLATPEFSESTAPDVCSYNGIWWWCAIGEDPFPLPPIAVPLHTFHHLTPCSSIAGDPKFVHCQGPDITALPRHLLPSNLTYLKVSNTNINRLDMAELAAMSVEFLYVTDNPLESVEGTFMDMNSSTRFLNLSYNQLTMGNSIHHSFFGTFRSMVGLEQLDLSFNRINLTEVDMFVKDTSPILPCLSYVSLKGNPLVRLERHIFHGLRGSRLKELNFQGCQLESIDPSRSF